MPMVGFEPTISAGKRPQTYASDCAPTGTGNYKTLQHGNSTKFITAVRNDQNIALHYHTIEALSDSVKVKLSLCTP